MTTRVFIYFCLIKVLTLLFLTDTRVIINYLLFNEEIKISLARLNHKTKPTNLLCLEKGSVYKGLIGSYRAVSFICSSISSNPTKERTVRIQTCSSNSEQPRYYFLVKMWEYKKKAQGTGCSICCAHTYHLLVLWMMPYKIQHLVCLFFYFLFFFLMMVDFYHTVSWRRRTASLLLLHGMTKSSLKTSLTQSAPFWNLRYCSVKSG